jgi:ribosomal protein S27AE
VVTDVIICGQCGEGRFIVTAPDWRAVCDHCGHTVHSWDMEDQLEPGQSMTWALGEPLAVTTEGCAVCGAPATDEVCDVNRMPAGVTVWVPVCDEHPDPWADDDE